MSTQPPWPTEPSQPDDRVPPPADSYSAPQYSAPQYDAPQYSAPQYSAPQYPAPPPAPSPYDTAPPAPGYPPYGPTYNYGPGYGYGYPVRPTNGLAIAALVCGLASFVTGITAPVAVVLGILALRAIQREGTQGRGMAIAGIAIGGVVTVGIVLIVIAYIGFFALAIGSTAGFNMPSTDYSAVSPFATSALRVVVG